MKVEKFILQNQQGELQGSPMSIAVHLHLFYPDLIPEFLLYLGHIPAPFTLLVSVPDGVEADDKELEKTFRSIPNIQHIVIRHTPNRGRDIAPMLCSFVDEIQECDIMLHLHTKKSPHEELQKGWLTHILKHLLPESDQLAAMLSLFKRDAGIIVPPDFVYRMTPDGWGYPENILLAQELLNRAGMNINLKEEYPEIDFPQGSMFWARTDFLRKLFSLGLTYEDFPEEPIGVDGTIAHALERLFFLWGKDDGRVVYRTFFSDSEVAQNQRFVLMARKLTSERQYFIDKNEKHLMICRILSVVCAILLLLLIISWLV